ncbi:MAG: hypothetical protein M1835_000474 [Candelina submexicana]|nr:MAG: hypothetical protein M1835_000474 [Candelina submexicana]
MSVSNGSYTQNLTQEVPFCHRPSADKSSDLSATCIEANSRPGLPFLTKRFTSSRARKITDSNDEKTGRGPLGLRLLHSSPEPLIDIIFVHGLRGGSIKTWRKGYDPRNIWPQLWLPVEPGLHNANIHSFGYDSDWASMKSSILNVHDFGQSLFEEMRNSSCLRNNENGPILLIGHSMGGLVVKKAFVLANNFPEFQKRIQCMFFLATPHRGSGYAAVLNNILTVSGIMSPRIETNLQESRERMKVLQSFLDISDHPDEHYPRVEGSCQWIDARNDFQNWRDPAEELIRDDSSAPEKNPSIFWVAANPGTGKTYLAAQVKDELAHFQLECSYYFFHIGNESSQSLGNKIDRIPDGYVKRFHDTAIIWTKIFKRGIFQARISTPQYWVIDAIDECSKYQELFTLIKGIQLSFPLKIFITSRKIPELQRIHRSLEASVSITCIEIPAEDSTSDIDCYIQERVKNLANHPVGGKKDIAETLLRRSNPCFLWVRLVLDELEKVYTTESITKILQSIPEGMVPYYERTARAMAENTLEKHVARAVLVWVVASSRNLNIPELSNALKLDINTVLPCAKSAVEGLCGQLIFIDQQSGMVSLVHTTVREFLLSESAGEFYILKSRAHERIALTCLKLLSSGEIKPPRSQRMLSQARKSQESSPLMNYAITQFSEHVYSTSAETDEILLALDLFLKTNILSWIERIAQMGDLYPLIRIVDSWSTDLSRIATKFGSALLQDPSSIYFVIPPFCPLDSAIYKQFAKRAGPSGLSVVGHKKNAWDDCIASVNFGEDSIAAAVSCGENLIAVGMESGDINLFNRKSYQKDGVIHEKHPIDLIHFTDRSIAACTTRSVVLMDRMGNTIWQIRLRFRCILLTSSVNAIIAVSQHGHVLKWDISTGALLRDQLFAYTSPDDDDNSEPSVKAPDVASLSADIETLALAYRWGTVCVFDFESGEVIAWPRDKYNRLAAVLLFNPNPHVSRLLIIYMDHKIALYETDTGALVSAQETSSTAGILSASCSPDGRTLATVDNHGILQIWDFESLSLLYHV